MTDEQIDIMRHTTGADSDSPGYRNRYCTELDNPDCLALVEAGFMQGPTYTDGSFGDGCGLFHVTEKGLKLLGIKRPSK